QIASSVTWSHGVNGDAGSPNPAWHRSDDLLFGGRLHAAVGERILEREGMPCVSYIHNNLQAASRSLHPGGVNILLADGHTRFVTNQVDRGMWHVMHSRETPGDVLTDLDSRLQRPPLDKISNERALRGPLTTRPMSPHLENSVAMEFALIP